MGFTPLGRCSVTSAEVPPDFSARARVNLALTSGWGHQSLRSTAEVPPDFYVGRKMATTDASPGVSPWLVTVVTCEVLS